MTKNLFFTLFVVILALLANHLVGSNDTFTVLLVFVAALIMKPVVLEFQMGGRELLSNHFNTESAIHAVVKKPGFLSHIFSIIAALIASLGLIVLLKGVVLSHGLPSFLILLFLITLALFPILGQSVERKKKKESYQQDKEGAPSDHLPKRQKTSEPHADNESSRENSESSAIDHHLVPSASRYASFVASLVVGIIALNLVMALLLSAKDTFIFLASEITFDNFDDSALSDAISYNGHNTYSRAPL